MASEFRDTGQSPQVAFGTIKKTFGQALPDTNIKRIVNADYFDPRLAGLSGAALAYAFENACMLHTAPPSPYKPLQ